MIKVLLEMHKSPNFKTYQSISYIIMTKFSRGFGGDITNGVIYGNVQQTCM